MKSIEPIQHTSVLLFENKEIRVITQNGKPYFVAKDVCEVLEINNHKDAISRLDTDEKGVGLTDTLGGKQKMLWITESGFYKLIMRSKKAVITGTQAYRFMNWICREVIPSIRKTGGYGVPFAELNDFYSREQDSRKRGSESGVGLYIRKVEKHALEREAIQLRIKYQPSLL